MLSHSLRGCLKSLLNNLLARSNKNQSTVCALKTLFQSIEDQIEHLSSHGQIVHTTAKQSFHVVERTKTSTKCTKMDVRVKRATLLFSVVKLNMQICDVLLTVVVVLACSSYNRYYRHCRRKTSKSRKRLFRKYLFSSRSLRGCLKSLLKNLLARGNKSINSLRT